jgi:hypothetical protein
LKFSVEVLKFGIENLKSSREVWKCSPQQQQEQQEQQQ